MKSIISIIFLTFLNIFIFSSTTYGFDQFIDPNPSTDNFFGYTVVPLSTGNVVVTSPSANHDSKHGVGAVYLFNGKTGELISELYGDTIYDGGLTDIVPLPNGNYLVISAAFRYHGIMGSGAITWCNGITGLSGTISADNSLVGTKYHDYIGMDIQEDYKRNSCITILPNSNYLIKTPTWDNGSIEDAGAVTWCDGTKAVCGEISEKNSLIGSYKSEELGRDSIVVLPNGNFLIINLVYRDDTGAITWGDGTKGICGEISDKNSIRSNINYRISDIQIFVLRNSNYFIHFKSYYYDYFRVGTFAFFTGDSGLSGYVGPENSMIGYYPEKIIELENDRCLLLSSDSIATWCNTKTGLNEFIDNPQNFVYKSFWKISPSNFQIKKLTNGNFLIINPDGNKTLGSVTLLEKDSEFYGPITFMNSFIGENMGDSIGSNGVIELPNGNIVISSPNFDNDTITDAGAVTLCLADKPLIGVVNKTNSLYGTSKVDRIGSSGIYVLPNSNYVVSSSFWTNDTIRYAGAVTWCNGATPTLGQVSSANSLVGTSDNDFVGYRITDLNNGNYVVSSPLWDDVKIKDVGAVTWCCGDSATTGSISHLNSRIGRTENDLIGRAACVALKNSNYVISSPDWSDSSASSAGAVTWCDGSIRTVGYVSRENSLTGAKDNERIGYNYYVNVINPLQNGDYLVLNPNYDNNSINNVGSVTLCDGTKGRTGIVNQSNSIIGSSKDDLVGSAGIFELPNSNFLIRSPNWDDGGLSNVGAVTFCNPGNQLTGYISEKNSLIGASQNDSLGDRSRSAIIKIPGNNHIILSCFYDYLNMENTGAISFGNNETGIIGRISNRNSYLGERSYWSKQQYPEGDFLQYYASDSVNKNVYFNFFEDGKVYVKNIFEINSISEKKNQTQKLNIYPNPAKNILNFEFESGEQNTIISEIISLDGALIKTKMNGFSNVGLTSVQIDVSMLPIGSYILSTTVGKSKYSSIFHKVKK